MGVYICCGCLANLLYVLLCLLNDCVRPFSKEMQLYYDTFLEERGEGIHRASHCPLAGTPASDHAATADFDSLRHFEKGAADTQKVSTMA